MGSTMERMSSSRTGWRAPISFQETLGTVVKPSRLLEGVIEGRTWRKSDMWREINSKPGGRGISSFARPRAAIRRAWAISNRSDGAYGSASWSACSWKAVIRRSMVWAPALPTRSCRSAPTKPAVSLASFWKSTLDLGILRVCVSKMR